jgi:hypothetical protein
LEIIESKSTTRDYYPFIPFVKQNSKSQVVTCHLSPVATHVLNVLLLRAVALSKVGSNQHNFFKKVTAGNYRGLKADLHTLIHCNYIGINQGSVMQICSWYTWHVVTKLRLLFEGFESKYKNASLLKTKELFCTCLVSTSRIVAICTNSFLPVQTPTYCLSVSYSFILGSLSFLGAAWAETKIWLECKQISFHRGDFVYHRLLSTWLAPKQSNINQFRPHRQYLFTTLK